MELITDNTKLWYFPPDSEDDVPRYAIQSKTTTTDIEDGNTEEKPIFKLYDEILPLLPGDILKIQPLRVNSDKMQVFFKNNSIGIVDFDNDEAEDRLTNFVAQWKNGLKFLDQTSSTENLSELRSLRMKEEKKRQKIELFRFLCTNLRSYIKPNDINVRIVSWNLQGQSRAFEKEKENIKKLLGIGNGNPSGPDIYVVNLQETIVLNTLSFYSSPVLVNEWANFILGILNDSPVNSRPTSASSNLHTSDRILMDEKDSSKYEYLVDNRLVGLSTIVFVRRYLKKQISNIEVSTTGTGILSMFGNKGAILIKFTFSYDKDILQYLSDDSNDLSEEEKKQVIHGYKFVLINAHLTAGDNNLSKRKKELQAIERNLNLKEYYSNDNIYLVNPLLTNEYYNTNEIDSFKFTDQETIRDNKLISLEDLSGSTDLLADSKKNSTSSLTTPRTNIGEKFQDIPLSGTNNKKIEDYDDETHIGSEKTPGSRLISPASPTFSIDPTAPFKNLISSRQSSSGQMSSMFNDCFILFGGDLNFRLLANTDDEIKELLIDKKIDELLSKDTLNLEKNNSNILSGFVEPPIEFLPTYKVKVASVPNLNDSTANEEPQVEDLSVNSDEDLPYDFSRVPAYCDRIFYSELNSDEEEKKHIRVNEYNSVFDTQVSDHKPIYLDLTLEKLQLIDFDERYKLMKNFLKDIDHQENSNKPLAEVSPIEIKASELKCLHRPKEYEFVITNKGKKKFSWEIVNYDEQMPQNFIQVETTNNSTHINENYLREPLIEISNTKGIIPANGISKIKIKLNSLSIGIKKINASLILRVIGSKDFFLSCEFTTAPSLFGESLDLLNNIKGFGSSSGIPPSIYELINYLSNHLNEDMFNDIYDFNNPAELGPKILNDLDLSIREQLENNGALDQEYMNQTDKFDIGYNSNSKVITRTLLLLLNNLDGGIIPKEFSLFILDEITLPSIFAAFNFNSKAKFELQSDITTKILEYLPGLRANVFMYICSFLTLYLSQFENKNSGNNANANIASNRRNSTSSSILSGRNPVANNSTGHAIDRNSLVALFEDALINLPNDASRAVRSKRREVLKILL